MLERRAGRYVRAPQRKAFDRELEVLLRDAAAALLAEAGVESDDPLLRLRRVDPAGDLAEIVGWPLQKAKIAWLKKRWSAARRRGKAWPRIDWRETVAFFEAHRHWIDGELKSLLDSLHVHLVTEGGRDAA